MMDRSGYLTYARDALDILAQNLRLYRLGVSACYRVVAVQLRLLLCDSNRVHARMVDISVIPRLFPELTLDALQPAGGAKPAEVGFIFSTGQEKLTLQGWLAQEAPIGPGRSIRLRELIRLVCEQDGGAHVDPHPSSDLPVWHTRAEMIVSLGEYVLNTLHPLLGGDEHRAA
jgi:hypothetical protein